MNKNAKRILKYFIEFLIVAFGVFLGIYTSNWQSKEKIKIEKEKSLNYIIEELENNKNKLQYSYDYHNSIKIELDSITQAIDNEQRFANYIGNTSFNHNQIKGWEGINTANLDDTAFEAAKISGIIKEFDFKVIQNISSIYKHQATYAEFGNSIFNKMINFNSSNKVEDVLGSLQLICNDLKNYEASLLEAIEIIQEDVKNP